MKSMNIMMAMILAMAFMPLAIAQEQTTTQAVQFTDIEPYEGRIPPGHFLYKFKLMFENVDEMVTIDPVKKMEKKLAHARTRLAEAKTEMAQNRTVNTEMVMAQYRQKMTDVESRFDEFKDVDVSAEAQAGLENAQLRIEHHRLILNQMIEDKPDNIGLKVAVQNAEQLRNRFEEKLGTTIDGVMVLVQNATQTSQQSGR